MKNSITSACPLDCYDACGLVFKEEKIKALSGCHTQGFLCPHLNHFQEFETISQARYQGKEITIDEALEKLKEILDSNLKSETLHYRGSGNFGLMQEVTDHVFASMGARLTDGTLCDGAGEAGIVEGRGSNKNMPLSEIAKSEVVIFWGRNPHVTSSHLLPMIKGKKIIVIDPVKTKIAKTADIHIQLKPHSDIYLALLLARFLHINELCDDDFLDEYGSEFEEYYELTQTVRIKATLQYMGITLGDIGDIIDLIKEKRVAIVCGVGLQKYSDGADVMRAIDALGVALGLFAKEGSGVAYLGNSKENIDSPFMTKAKRVSKVNTPFEDFKTVFIQGANPLAQMPDTLRVEKSLELVENIVYFGLYENETSAIADLVIPAKSFLYKNDVRTSYSHHGMLGMKKQAHCDIGISEYDLSAFLAKEFEIALESEAYYLEYFMNFGVQKINGCFEVEGREDTPYKDGFDTDDGEFVFLEEVELDKKANKITLRKNEGKKKKVSDELFLITPKSPKSLNSQFKRETQLYINSSHGYEEGEKLCISSVNGSLELCVAINEDLRDDSVLIYSGTPGVNKLTTSKHSIEGKCAIYQENKVNIMKA